MSYPTLEAVFQLDIDLRMAKIDHDTFQYQGYEPGNTYRVLIEKAKRAGENSEAFFISMRQVLTFYVSRGTKIQTKKVKGKSSEAAKKILLRLVEKYDITDNRPTDKDDITVARIVGVFPHLVAQLMADEDIGRIVGSEKPGLPRALHFSAAPSLIPNGSTYDDLFLKWYEWATSFDIIINGANADSEKVLNYGQIMRKSSYLSDDRRIMILGKIGVRV